VKKWVHELNGILKGRGTNAQQIHEEVFSFPGYKRDANQKYTKISSQSPLNDHIKGQHMLVSMW
jgi:hypothetical protein